MKTPQFALAEYVSNAVFNTAVATDVGNIASLGAAVLSPGLCSPSSLSVTPSGLVVNVVMSLPFGIIFSSGNLVQAHGSQTNADTQTYAVPFSGALPGSGTATGYLIATSGQIQQNPYQVLGPPPGHPDYNPTFVAYTAYSTLTDTLLLSGSVTPADGLNTFELARFTLVAGASSVGSADLSKQIASSVFTSMSPQTTPSGTVQILGPDSGTLFNAANGATTYVLPPNPSTLNGSLYGFMSSTTSAVSIHVSGAVGIYGTPSAPASGATTLALMNGNSTFIAAVNGRWQVVGGNQSSARARLVANTTFYVDGSFGSNTTGDGTSGNPWQTLPFAISALQENVDFAGFVVTLQLADYATGYGDATISGPFIGLTGYNSFIINGNSGTPTNTPVGNISFANGGQGLCQNVYFNGGGTGYGLSAYFLGIAGLGSNCRFASMGGYHIDCRQNGLIYVVGSYSVTGGASAHVSAQSKGTVTYAANVTCTVTGTPTFGPFALVDNLSTIIIGASVAFSGAANGQRYSVTATSNIIGTGGNANLFPGNSGGVTATQGQYLN